MPASWSCLPTMTSRPSSPPSTPAHRATCQVCRDHRDALGTARGDRRWRLPRRPPSRSTEPTEFDSTLQEAQTWSSWACRLARSTCCARFADPRQAQQADLPRPGFVRLDREDPLGRDFPASWREFAHAGGGRRSPPGPGGSKSAPRGPLTHPGHAPGGQAVPGLTPGCFMPGFTSVRGAGRRRSMGHPPPWPSRRDPAQAGSFARLEAQASCPRWHSCRAQAGLMPCPGTRPRPGLLQQMLCSEQHCSTGKPARRPQVLH